MSILTYLLHKYAEFINHHGYHILIYFLASGQIRPRIKKMIESIMEWLETNVLGACARVDIEDSIETFDKI